MVLIMEDNIIQFLSNPTISDVISYFLIFLMFISEWFMKKFVKKDNIFTSNKINEDVKKISKLNEELSKAKQTLESAKEIWDTEKEQWAKEKQELLDIQQKQAQAIALISGNTAELVKSGVANKVATMLDIQTSEDLKSVETNGGNKDE
jgi:ABC-type multidrug transport system fused ATPase/permease subunit